MNIRAWKAYGIFAGGVIGVGVFGLPAVLARAGVLVFLLYAIGVAVLLWWIHACYLAVVQATPGRHRLTGYVRLRLGSGWFAVVACAHLLGFVGTLVAYLIAGGGFLQLLLERVVSIPPEFATVLYLAPGALLLLVGIRVLPLIELGILGLFLLVLLLVPVVGIRALSFTNLPLLGDPRTLLLPYGILLFAYSGISLIPETFEIAGKRNASRVLSLGLATAVLTYLLFAFSIAGITGSQTTEDALTGLRDVFGDGVVTLALIFGLLTTFSSYLALGLTLLRTLVMDFRFPRLPAWALTVGVPIILVLLGVRSLLAVISVTGAVFLGIEGLAVLAMYRRLVTGGRSVRAGRLSVAIAAVSVLLVAGVVTEITHRLFF